MNGRGDGDKPVPKPRLPRPVAPVAKPVPKPRPIALGVMTK
jgi:hypothetical protein